MLVVAKGAPLLITCSILSLPVPCQVMVIQTAPSVRVSIGEELGLAPGRQVHFMRCFLCLLFWFRQAIAAARRPAGKCLSPAMGSRRLVLWLAWLQPQQP